MHNRERDAVLFKYISKLELVLYRDKQRGPEIELYGNFLGAVRIWEMNCLKDKGLLERLDLRQLSAQPDIYLSA